MKEMANLMENVMIKDDVRSMLGSQWREFKTWGDVDVFMPHDGVCQDIRLIVWIQEKLRNEYKIRKQEIELAKAKKYDLILPSTQRALTRCLERLSFAQSKKTKTWLSS